jgi:hypothetical protein
VQQPANPLGPARHRLSVQDPQGASQANGELCGVPDEEDSWLCIL